MTAQPARAAAPQPPILLRETLDGIAVLTLNRPGARNSLSEGMIAEVHAALQQIDGDASVRALVIPANAPAFSAGHAPKLLTARRRAAARAPRRFAERTQPRHRGEPPLHHPPPPVVRPRRRPMSS